jgi:hypothetical protein
MLDGAPGAAGNRRWPEPESEDGATGGGAGWAAATSTPIL